MENGRLSAEEIRREKRRQKILLNSNDRMKKIISGSSDDSHNTVETLSVLSERVWEPDVAALPSEESLPASNTEEAEQKPSVLEHMHNEDNLNVSDLSESTSDLLNPERHKLGDSQISGSEGRLTNNNEGFTSFTTVRTLLVLVSGILVRLSFLFSFGEQYVQTIFNPFMAMEIAIIGYQKAVNMDFGADVNGGIWLSTLVLAGFKPEIITSYKTVMGILSAVGMDFTLYLLGIIITHIMI